MNEKKKNSLKKIVFVFFLLLAVSFTTKYVMGTYAKYTSTITPSAATATIAKWDFDVENASVELDIDLATTVDASTLIEDRIAPGTEGSFAIALTNANTETGVDFEIAFTSVTGQPTHFKFYTDEEHTDELDVTNDTITGQLASLDEDGVTANIYWAWPYESGDDLTDTTEGKAGGESGTPLSISMTITGTQTAPSSTAITSHVNE